jgi:hypothetical protein
VSPAAPGPAGFATRIGLAVLCPRLAAMRLCDGERGGLRDAALLFLPRVVAGDEVSLTFSLVHLSDAGAAGLLDVVLDALRALTPDLIGIALGGIVMSLLLGPRERLLRPGLTIDLSAQAWLLWLFLLVVAKLGLTVLRLNPPPLWAQLGRYLALAAVALHWFNGLLVARRRLAALAAAQQTETQGKTP